MVQEGSNKFWTDAEITALEENFSSMQNQELSNALFNGEKFTDRSVNAIKHKARRLNLSKRDNYEILRLIEEDYDVEFDDDNFARFICGFVAGEGSFVRNKTKDTNRYNFSISMSAVDTEILYNIEDFFGVGNVYEYESRKDNWKDTVQYQVQSVGEIYNVIIPFFDRYGFYETHKQKQFEEWKWEFLDYHNLTERFK